jgi:hypothetical protein
MKNLSKVASLWAKIWSWELPNMKQACYPLNHNVQYIPSQQVCCIINVLNYGVYYTAASWEKKVVMHPVANAL